MLKSCLLIFKFIPVCLSVTLLLPIYGADWKFFEFASVVLSLYKEIFAFVFKNFAALLLHSLCISTKDFSLAYFVCQSNWSRSGSFVNFGILILCLDLRNLISYFHESPVPVATRPTAWVCGHSPAEFTGSNPARCMDVCCEYCVLSVSGLCPKLITCPGESHRVWCVDVCDPQNLKKLGGPSLHWTARPQEQKYPAVKAIPIIVCNPFYPFCTCLSFNGSRDGMNNVLKILMQHTNYGS
jgi:hypothetical protein